MDEDQLFAPPMEPPPVKRSETGLILERLDRMPTRADLYQVAFLGMAGGACLTQALMILFR